MTLQFRIVVEPRFVFEITPRYKSVSVLLEKRLYHTPWRGKVTRLINEVVVRIPVAIDYYGINLQERFSEVRSVVSASSPRGRRDKRCSRFDKVLRVSYSVFGG